MANKKLNKKQMGNAIAIIILVLFMTLIGGFAGYNMGVRHNMQPSKPEPFTINGYTSESDFYAIFAQIVWDRFDNTQSQLRDYTMGLNYRIADLEDSNKSMKSKIDNLELNITYLINVLGHNGIQVDVQCLNNGKITEPCNK